MKRTQALAVPGETEKISRSVTGLGNTPMPYSGGDVIGHGTGTATLQQRWHGINGPQWHADGMSGLRTCCSPFGISGSPRMPRQETDKLHA